MLLLAFALTSARARGTIGSMSDPSLPYAEPADPSEQVVLRTTLAWLAEEGSTRAAEARAFEPLPDSRQAVRGRFFAVIELEGHTPEAANLAPVLTSRVLDALQRTYFSAKGSQSAVLGEAVRQARAVVQGQNERDPANALRLSIACATLLHRRLMISCSGGAFVLLRNGGRLELFPSDPAQLAPDDPALAPEPEVLRWQAGPGDAMLMAGPGWGRSVPIRTLASTVYYVTSAMLDEAAVGLREQKADESAPGLLIAFDAMLSPPQAPRPTTPLTARRVTPQGLPTSLGAEPPVSAPPRGSENPQSPFATPRPSSSPPSPASTSDAGSAEALSAAARAQGRDAFPLPVAPHAYNDSAVPRPTVDLLDATAASVTAFAANDALPGAADVTLGASTADRVRATAHDGIVRARLLFRQMLPERRTTPDDFEESDFGAGAANPAAVTGGAAAGAAAPAITFPPMPLPTGQAVSEVARPAPYRPPAPATGSRARLFITLALLVALLVPVVVLAVNWERGARMRAEAATLVTLGQQRAREAQTFLDSGDKRTALNAASEAHDFVDRAVELIGVSAPINELRNELRIIEQEASNVESLYALTDPLIRFPDGSSPSHVLVVDQDLYVLDPGRGVVERYRLDPSLEMVPEQNGEVVLRTGQQLGGATVGPLLDMAWQPVIPGWDDKARLLVLDSRNQVFNYDPRVEGPGLLELAGSDQFQNLRQLETYNGRLYLADVGRGQVQRYEAGQYASPPSDWFDTSTNLAEMISMSIDGDIWMLMKNGQVLQFFSGQQQAFSLDNNVGLVREAVDFVVGDGTNPYIYVADRGGERIWVYDKTGEYVKQFAASEGNPLRGLSSLYVDGVTDSMYFLTPQALYKHPLPRD